MPTAAERRRPPSRTAANGYSPGEVAILGLLQGANPSGAASTERPLATIDPSLNVKELVQEKDRRQDDLRRAERVRNDDLRKADRLRWNDIRKIEGKRQDDLREATTYWRTKVDDLRATHIDNMLVVRFQAQGDLAQAESRRIDAITLAESRRIDALLKAAADAVTLASTRAELTASALAERVDTSAKTLAQSVVSSAEALRLQVETTTTSITRQIDTLREENGKRITQLEQSRYQLGGQAEVRTELRTETRQMASDTRQQFQFNVSTLIALALLAATVVYTVHLVTGR